MILIFVAIFRNEEIQEELRHSSHQTQQRHRRIVWKHQAMNYDPVVHYSTHKDINIGTMSAVCKFCGALKWPKEPPGLCCNNGKIKLPLSQPPPLPLCDLLDMPTSPFLSNIRRYNSAFQMTSFGCSKEVREPGFMPTFKVQGQVYHQIGSLLPSNNEPHRFLQIYFMGDSEQEAARRCDIIPNLNKDLITELQTMLHEHNYYVNEFKTALDKMDMPEHRVVIRPDKAPSREHSGRYNAPTTNEVAVLIVENRNPREIVLEKRNDRKQYVSDTHRSYDPLQYPLLFPRGEDGYCWKLPTFNPSTGQMVPKPTVSAMSFYAYHMMKREQSFNTLLKGRDLLNQFAVDMYAKIEGERLSYIRNNQSQLRSATYTDLRDEIRRNENQTAGPSNIGRPVCLPSSFIGGPRYMHERAQDAMTYVRKFGRPHLFITFTCNPTWPEIQAELFEGQTAKHRNDIVARVFNLKLHKMMDLMTKLQVFGEVQCYVYTIEWQKRGLPHAHILIWLKDAIRPVDLDRFISAEIPDETTDPGLNSIVTKNMIHGPCGALNRSSPCMKDGKCSKGYPKDLREETMTDGDGFPLYRRRSPDTGGHTTRIQIKGVDITIDNKWVVPYCPLLSKAFSAHINVEFCNSVKAIKYICKYIYKGSDQAIFTVSSNNQQQAPINEVDTYISGRYISSNEAFWRILGMDIHERYPPVERLAVHLENGQRVVFNIANAEERAEDPPKTTLTEFFALCRNDEFAKTLLYCQVPTYYIWQGRQWRRRKRGQKLQDHPGIFAADTVGRIYTIHPSNFECYCLRLLLHVVKGPTSFKSLKTIEGEECATFQQACYKAGLLADDTHWDDTLTEAATCHTAHKLRDLFAVMIVTCGLHDAPGLWEKHKESLSEDISYRVCYI